MKIAVTATGKTQDSQTDPRFGRAAVFVVVDTETREFSAIDNSESLNAPHGAGVQAASRLSRLDVDLVITGHCGPKALRALEAAGIDVVLGAAGTATDAIDKFEAGALRPTDRAHAESHPA